MTKTTMQYAKWRQQLSSLMRRWWHSPVHLDSNGRQFVLSVWLFEFYTLVVADKRRDAPLSEPSTPANWRCLNAPSHATICARHSFDAANYTQYTRPLFIKRMSLGMFEYSKLQIPVWLAHVAGSIHSLCQHLSSQCAPIAGILRSANLANPTVSANQAMRLSYVSGNCN